ncbi:MAG: hypothetical protein KBH07_11545 [Flavobacteriales bacterium]|nr:hypothetical protein [Flavobacteriales bacterium]MBP9081008.1 hypothetical protein [Flavobacteriales bacterium]
MTGRRFHSRRSYRYFLLLGAGGMCLGLAGLLATDLTGSDTFRLAGLALVAVAFAAAAVVQYLQGVEYVLGPDGLLLRRGEVREELPLELLLDANVVDMDTARGYAKVNTGTDASVSIPERASLTRYCSVPLQEVPLLGQGLPGAGSLGSRRSMVLLRIRDGRLLLLSPKHCHGMASAISKAINSP